MILINDEKRGRFIDVKIIQRQLIEYIKDCREDIDACQKDFVDGKYPPLMLTEFFTAIAEARSQLQAVSEMQKIPFDVLIVIEKEK